MDNIKNTSTELPQVRTAGVSAEQLAEDRKAKKELAEHEFERFAEGMDLLLDPATMDAEDLTSFEKHKARLIREIMRGSLVVNELGEAIYTPYNARSKHKEPIHFQERSGGSLTNMDGKKKNHDVAKTYAVLAGICGLHPSVFVNLYGTDIKVCESLFALLMD